jgi:YesN/AraC family two-component response regulator
MASAGGEEGIALAASWEPHIVLLDVRMPGRSGLEIAAELSATGLARRVRH